jgi:hypothetical protein
VISLLKLNACVPAWKLRSDVFLAVCKKKSKAVPLHAMKAPVERGGVAPTHS